MTRASWYLLGVTAGVLLAVLLNAVGELTR
jgi:hypothetical protein